VVTILALLGVLGVLVAAAIISTREEPLLADAPQDTADLPLPDEPLTPDDVRRLRFSMAPRGYRMSEVDLALERLQAELADRDRRIGLLEARAEGAQRAEVREATVADLPVPPPAPVVQAPAPVAAPAVEPPVVEPPVIDPPVVDPPAVEPPVVEPPAPEPAPPLHQPDQPEQPSSDQPHTVQQQPVGSADFSGIPPLPPVTPAVDGAHVPEELPPADLGSELTRPPEERQQ
jgi:DivIVA domain-containing protein